MSDKTPTAATSPLHPPDQVFPQKRLAISYRQPPTPDDKRPRAEKTI
ncbi:MAG TPA: hypothetical protein VFT59_02045 [Candidatus Saccharimonadales bacterium]|nr:hypothetical protein [Candidatus Saccharimonadales bacterium]